jgi:hypothetical protein
MFLICELVYHLFIMFMSYLASYSHVSIYTVYELVYSPHIMYVLYLAQSFNVHIMFMNRNRFMLRWWFIMLSGMPMSFTYRSVGSGT